MWIKISPEQGHAAHTHTSPGAHTSQALSGGPNLCTWGYGTRRFRGRRGHLPMQGQGGRHRAGTPGLTPHKDTHGYPRTDLTHARESQLPWLFGTHTEAKRHYGRHSLGFVLLIVSTGLNVSGQFYLHIAE